MAKSTLIFTHGWFMGSVAVVSKRLPIFTHGWFALAVLGICPDEVLFRTDVGRELVRSVGVGREFDSVLGVGRELSQVVER